MKNTIAFGFLFLSLLNACLASTDPVHVHLSLDEDASTMNVVWATFPSGEEPIGQVHGFVEYGEEPGVYPYFNSAVSRRVEYGENTEEKKTLIHHAKMVGLKAETVYYYRVGSINNRSKQFQFKSSPLWLPAEGSAVRFAAYGDMGIFEDGLATVDALERKTFPVIPAFDFFLHVGDMAYAFGNWTKWDTFFTRIERLAGFAPYMISPGNRDETEITKERFVYPSIGNAVSDFSTNAKDEPNLYLSYDKENPLLYYSFDYGYVHVVSVSIKDKYTPDSAQYKWLEYLLARLQKRVADSSSVLRWVVVIGHTPLYSSSNGHTGGNKELKDSIEHLLVKYGVHLAIWGDDHNYERTWPVYKDEPDITQQTVTTEEGTAVAFVNPKKPIHLLAGTAGIGLDGWANDLAPVWSAYREISHGYVDVEATENYLKVKFVRSKDGVVGDRFWIVKQTSAPSRQAMMLVGLAVSCGILLFLVKEKKVSLPLPMGRKHT